MGLIRKEKARFRIQIYDLKSDQAKSKMKTKTISLYENGYTLETLKKIVEIAVEQAEKENI